MYIEKIRINKFRVLEDIEVRFQEPDLTAVEEERGNGNVVNVIAGVNGTGKTSLLDALYMSLSKPDEFEDTFEHGTVFPSALDGYQGKDIKQLDAINKIPHMINQKDTIGVKKSTRLLSVRLNLDAKYKHLPVPTSYPSVIKFPSYQNFPYKMVQQLDLCYQFSREIDAGQLLGNAEYFIKEFVVGVERQSHTSDPQERAQHAVDVFNLHFSEARMLLTRLENLDRERFNRPVFRNAANEMVTIDQLSDGEKQLYGRVIALMLLKPSNSVILIDEPEIALHPAWQQKIMQIYSRIGTNNQFIVATHSPQVIRSVPYKNRIILSKQDGKIQPVYFDKPPSGVDVNSILSEVMGADPIPVNVLNLYQEYRGFVESGQEQSEGAQSIRRELLQYEGEHSAFMQEMNFLIELRDAA